MPSFPVRRRSENTVRCLSEKLLSLTTGMLLRWCPSSLAADSNSVQVFLVVFLYEPLDFHGGRCGHTLVVNDLT